MMNAATSSHQTRWLGAGAYWANALAPIAPEGLSACRRRAGHDGCDAAFGPQVEQCRTGRSGDQANGDALQRATRE
jgi:hypothetical protein